MRGRPGAVETQPQHTRGPTSVPAPPCLSRARCIIGDQRDPRVPRTIRSARPHGQVPVPAGAGRHARYTRGVSFDPSASPAPEAETSSPSPVAGTSVAISPEPGPDAGAGTWVVLPTYDEAENLPAISDAILRALPGAMLLVVDDASPDGTGDLADQLARSDPRIRVRHRPGKAGLGRAYLDGFGVALAAGAETIVQMDADWSHDPLALPSLLAPIAADEADLVIGSRYIPGGGVTDWGIGRRAISRGGSVFARLVLDLEPRDLTGGFKAWRATTLDAVRFEGVRAGGYVFQIEMTYRASRFGARIREVPITFRDRRVGQSKMSRRIVVEALFVVLQLRWEEARGRAPFRRGA
jgi:dolichol-phosphate mannosyltransferase